MAATQNSTAKSDRVPFAAREFDAILQGFDASAEDDIRKAMAAAFSFCDRLRLPFREAARLTYERDAEFEALRARCLEITVREKQKDAQIANLMELLAKARDTCGQLKEQNVRLTQGARFCAKCDMWRRVVAGIVGLLAGGFWCRFAWRAMPGPSWVFWCVASLLAFGPVAGVYLHWRWFLFAQKINFRSLRDNELSRALLQRWKEL